MIPGPRIYTVNRAAREPLVNFMTDALVNAGCRIIHCTPADRAPFVVAFETKAGERMGIVAYAFLITRTPTTNRPADEQSFQIKYGSKEGYADNNKHELWQDPLGMFTTILVGIDPRNNICVSADPIVHSPTKFFIRMEFKDEHAEAIRRDGWHAWERSKRNTPPDAPRVETLVGATQERFLDLIRFERSAHGVDPGNRLILAALQGQLPRDLPPPVDAEPNQFRIAAAHPLVAQFGLDGDEILNLIAGASRLRMAVKGWVAEEHLRRTLSAVRGISHCERLDEEGGPDLRVSFHGGPMLTIECKNVSRDTDRFGNPRVDFQRTRSSKGNPCSRFYRPEDFDIVAACLHAVTADWDFRFIFPDLLDPHKTCEGRIAPNVKVDQRWQSSPADIFMLANSNRGYVA